MPMLSENVKIYRAKRKLVFFYSSPIFVVTKRWIFIFHDYRSTWLSEKSFAIWCSLSLVPLTLFKEKRRKNEMCRKSVFTSSAEKKTFFFNFLNINFTIHLLAVCWGFHFTHSLPFTSFAARSSFICICLRWCIIFFFLAISLWSPQYFLLTVFIILLLSRINFVTCLISSVFDRNQSFARN